MLLILLGTWVWLALIWRLAAPRRTGADDDETAADAGDDGAAQAIRAAGAMVPSPRSRAPP
ncbi:hypothetical protein ACEYYB_09940 [Paracoccus sp. p4-l81]